MPSTRAMHRYLFTRALLFVIACCGWALVFFGGWIAWRGVFLYARDPVLMGTGGGLAIGGLLVVALTLAAQVQVRTAEAVAAILARLDAAPPRQPHGRPHTKRALEKTTGLRAPPRT